VAEVETLEVETQKLREENSELRRRLAETPTLEASLKKAEAKAETLEEKVGKDPTVAWHTTYV
jgi:homeobox protein cut-like